MKSSQRTWVILIVAVVLGGGAGTLSMSYLKNQKEAMVQQAKQAGGKTVAVIVASKNLRKGDLLDASNLSMRDIPADFSHSLAFSSADFKKIDGKTLSYPLRSGEMVLASLIQGGIETFSTRVEPGRRALTMQVDEISSISGLLEPGDSIDILLSLPGGIRAGEPQLILQGVQVMATGQRLVNDPKTGESRRYSTVTLNTTPEQASNLIAARDMGKITALLRNPSDKPVEGPTELNVRQLSLPKSPVIKSASVAKPAATESVEIWYGSQDGKIVSGSAVPMSAGTSAGTDSKAPSASTVSTVPR